MARGMNLHRSLSAGALSLLLGACAHAQSTGGQRPLTLDTHVDIPSGFMREPRFDVGNDTMLLVDLPKMQRGGLDATFLVIFVEQGPLTPEGYAKAVAQAERKYSAIELMLQKYPQRIRLATTPAQVRDNRAHGVLSAMIGVENAYSLGHDLRRIDAAYARGARYLGLVHVGNNDLCTSSLPNVELGESKPATAGITEFGRDAVARANRLGMWDAALYDDRLLGAESRELAFTAHTQTDDPDVGYGFGWRITGETLWHSGESIGFRNVIVRYPKQRLTVVILSNRDDPEPYPTAQAIARKFLSR